MVCLPPLNLWDIIFGSNIISFLCGWIISNNQNKLKYNELKNEYNKEWQSNRLKCSESHLNQLYDIDKLNNNDDYYDNYNDIPNNWEYF